MCSALIHLNEASVSRTGVSCPAMASATHATFAPYTHLGLIHGRLFPTHSDIKKGPQALLDLNQALNPP